MDKALRKDIEKEYSNEYYLAEKGKEGRFLKAYHKFNAALEGAFNKVKLDSPTVALLGTAALFAVAPHAAIAVACFWAVNGGIGFHSNAMCQGRADEALAKDIDNGLLSDRYAEVLDSRIKGLNEKIGLYAAQKGQLPPKGAAAAAFASANAGTAPEPKAAAPAPRPETPKL